MMKATKLMALGLVGLTTLGLAATANAAENTKSQPTTEASIEFGNYEYLPEVEGPGGGTYDPNDQNPGAVQNNGWQLIAPKAITFTNNANGGTVTDFGEGKFYALKETVTGDNVENHFVPLSLKLVYNSELNQTAETVTEGHITATRTALISSATEHEVEGSIGIDAVTVADADTFITEASLSNSGEDNLIPVDTANPLAINFKATQPSSGTAQGLIFLAENADGTKDPSVTGSGIYIQLNSALQDTTVTSTITWTLTTGTVAGG